MCLTQIHTYCRLEPNNLNTSLNKFQHLLQALNCYDQNVSLWLSQIEPPDEEGHVFGQFNSYQLPVAISGKDFLITPSILGLTEESGIYKSPWIHFYLLFEMKDIYDFKIMKYKSGVGKALWHMMNIAANFFPDAGVLLTDDFEDGYTSAVLTGEKEDFEVWSFDLASIPMPLVSHFKHMPETFVKHVLVDRVGLARKKAWSEMPWQR